MARKSCFFLIVLFFSSISFAGAEFYEDAGANQFQKVVFDFGSGLEWKRVVTEVDGQYYGHKGADDTWLLKGGEAFVWKDNGSDITSVKLHYRIYKEGDTPPAFSDINLPWDSDVGGNNQRWASTAENIDIIAASGSAGRWYVEFYYSATTNGVDSAPVIYFSNNGANYTLYFDRDVISVDLTSFDAEPLNDGILIRWSAASEINHAGYNLYRSQSKSNSFVRINEKLIIRADVPVGGEAVYDFVDYPPTCGVYEYKLEAVGLDGSVSVYGPVTASVTTGVASGFSPASGLWLIENYPNPFNPATTIHFTAPEAAPVDVSVFDVNGRKVAALLNGRVDKGSHRIHWNGRNDAGDIAPSGVYFLRLLTDKTVQNRKITKMQ